MFPNRFPFFVLISLSLSFFLCGAAHVGRLFLAQGQCANPAHAGRDSDGGFEHVFCGMHRRTWASSVFPETRIQGLLQCQQYSAYLNIHKAHIKDLTVKKKYILACF